MQIKETNLKFAGEQTKRQSTEWIVLHHTATQLATVESIHKYHRDTNGWLGIGYNYFINRNGIIFKGREEESQGAHCVGYNHKSIGICFEGDFRIEHMTQEQKQAGVWLLKDLQARYSNAKIIRHKDVNDTDCPGPKFDDNIIIEAMQKEKVVSEAVKAEEFLKKIGIDTKRESLLLKLTEIYQNSFDVDFEITEDLKSNKEITEKELEIIKKYIRIIFRKIF